MVKYGNELDSGGEIGNGKSIGSARCLHNLYLVFAIGVNSPCILMTRNVSKTNRNCNL